MVRNRTLKPAVPYAGVYGSTAFTVTTTPQVLTLDHSCFVTSHFRVELGSGKVVLRKGMYTGIVNFTASISAIKATGNPSYILLEAYKNGVACTCGKAYGYIGAGVDNSTAVLMGCTEISPGDYLQFKVTVDDGTATLIDDSCRVIIEGVPMHGWDNNRGGKLRITGDVIR